MELRELTKEQGNRFVLLEIRVGTISLKELKTF